MSTDSQVFWKGPPLCSRIAWHLFCSLAVHGGLCWEGSVCISSLAQVHGILTVGWRQGRLVKKLTWRQDELVSATLSLFCIRGQTRGKPVSVPSASSLTAEQSHRDLDLKRVWNASISCFYSCHANPASRGLGFYAAAPYGRNLVRLSWKWCWKFHLPRWFRVWNGAVFFQ